MNKEELAQNLGELWSEYLAEIPKANVGELLVSSDGKIVNSISMEDFMGWLAIRKEVEGE